MLAEAREIRNRQWNSIRSRQIEQYKQLVRSLHQNHIRTHRKSKCRMCYEQAVYQAKVEGYDFLLGCLHSPQQHCQKHEKQLKDQAIIQIERQPSLFYAIFCEVDEWEQVKMPVIKRTLSIYFEIICKSHQELFPSTMMDNLIGSAFTHSLVNLDFIYLTESIIDPMDSLLLQKTIQQTLALLAAISPKVILAYPQANIVSFLLACDQSKIHIIVWDALGYLLIQNGQFVQQNVVICEKFQSTVVENILMRKSVKKLCVEELQSMVNFLATTIETQILQLTSSVISWAEERLKLDHPKLYDYLVNRTHRRYEMEEQNQVIALFNL